MDHDNLDDDRFGAAAARENFPVAARLLPRRYRADLMAVYGYARMVDDIGDEESPDRRSALLDEVDRDLDRVYAGGRARNPVIGAMAATVRGHRIPEEPFRRLVGAGRQDQEVHRYETFEDLLGYCALSADPVGHIVLHVFDAATPARLALSDRICSALQILEHCQDAGEDLGRGRVYLPAEDLRRFGCGAAELRASHASTRLRGVIALEVDRADRMLTEGVPITRGLPVWARLAVSGYIAGGRATVAALQHAAYDVLGAAPRPRRSRLLTAWLALLTGVTTGGRRTPPDRDRGRSPATT